jgi:hypothetical protein
MILLMRVLVIKLGGMVIKYHKILCINTKDSLNLFELLIEMVRF